MNLTIFADKEQSKIHPFWFTCVGSCHAATALRADWRAQLKKCREELGFTYVRFHGLLNDDMSVCLRTEEGALEYSFFNIDSIFDFLLSIGMKPFVELSFMPGALASGSTTVFHYKGNITPPRSYEEWGHLIKALAQHLVDRYGKEEVRTWFFEVWNEPNLDMFWTGTQEDYFKLYEYAARAIKEVDSQLKVGGPSTAIDAWVPELKAFCATKNVPLDFISTHHYPTDLAFSLGTNMEERMAKAQRGELAWRAKKVVEDAAPLTVYYTEWNNSPSPRDYYHDIPYNAAFIVKTLIDIMDLPLGCYSFWTFSDIFEECGFSSLPFHGGFGLLTIHGIPKPSYRAFQFLSRLGKIRLWGEVQSPSPTVDWVATKNEEGLMILLTNHQIPLSPIHEEDVVLTVKGFPKIEKILVERIDENHGNPRKTWEAMGKPVYLTDEQVQTLINASTLSQESISWQENKGDLTFKVTLQPHSVVAIFLRIKK